MADVRVANVNSYALCLGLNLDSWGDLSDDPSGPACSQESSRMKKERTGLRTAVRRSPRIMPRIAPGRMATIIEISNDQPVKPWVRIDATAIEAMIDGGTV